MKLKRIIICFIILFAACGIYSCSKGSDTPVDQIVELLDQATKKTEEINSMAELTDIKNVISPNDVWSIIQENADYKLSKGDKEKLKKSYNKLVETAFKKSSEYLPSQEYKDVVKNQLDLMMEAIDRNIDEAETLGSIRAFN